jgi:hypothetical protein
MGTTQMSKRITAPKFVEPNSDYRIPPKPPELANLFAKADQLLAAGRPAEAFLFISRAKSKSPWATNALAVCQLRQGNVRTALDIFRGLVLAAGGINVRSDIPVVFKTNFAVTLLHAQNVAGCLSVLAKLNEDEHPTVARLNAAIDRWKANLTLWERMNWYMGGHPDRPVEMDFPSGDLE